MHETAEKNKTKNENLRYGKITFTEKNYWQLPYSGEFMPKIKVSTVQKQGTVLSRYPESKEIVTIQYEGKLSEDIKIGEPILQDQVISKAGSLIKKQITSPVGGKVVEINSVSQEISIEADSLTALADKFVPTIMPFDAKIFDIHQKSLTLEFAAVNINLFAIKGQDAIGKLKYISSKLLQDKDNFPENLENSILVTDTVSADMYPHLSAIGVAGLVLNHIDYALYSQIVTFTMPIAVISGFGNLNEDGKLVKYFDSKKDSIAIVDSAYKRLLICDSEKSSWINNYHFDLEKLGVISK